MSEQDEVKWLQGLRAVSYTHLDVYKRQVLGLLTYVLFKLFAGKYRELNLTMYILSILCILKYVFV